MAKRRVTAVDDSDDEDQTRKSPPAPKRARTVSDAESEPIDGASSHPKRETRRSNKGKGKARQDSDGEDDEEVDEADVEVEKPEDDDEVDEQKFEEEHGAAIRASLEAKRSVHGVRGHSIIFDGGKGLRHINYRESLIMA
jgi:hypothetical protein